MELFDNIASLKEIDGTVEEVIYKNADNGYIVLNLDNHGVLIPVVGILGDIVEGEGLSLQGNYIQSPKYGKQFKAETCQRTLPQTKDELIKYLGSGIIKGVGPALAKRIVAAFDMDSLDILENDYMKLSQIKGITADRAIYIGQEFRRICGVKNVVEFLGKYEMSPALAILVWKRYGNDSIAQIKLNPYLLCSDGLEMDFELVDSMANQLGFKVTDINRVKAGIIYVLRENSFAGHTCLPETRLMECVCRNLEISEDLFSEALSFGVESDELVHGEISGKAYVYLDDFYTAEQYIADKLALMMKLNTTAKKDYSKEISAVEFSENIQYEILQKAAINGCMSESVFILTGGPGTGKTTTLNGVIRLFKDKKKSLALCAPTGRAAKRMSDLTGEPSKTIHRLLEVDFSKDDKLTFKRNELNPLNVDVVIVDEMSMVDCLLMESLLRAIKPGAKLIMVGDSNQLPSVGAGNILRELMSTHIIPTVELKEIFRQAAESLIVTNAHKIVKGEIPELDDRKKDFFFMNCPDESEIPRLIIELTKKRLPSTYGYSPIDDIQILTPTKMGPVGTRELNKSLQLALNPPSRNRQEVKFADVQFRCGDKVMQIKNDYDVLWTKDGQKGSGVFNGDIGIIKEVDRFSGNVVIDFDGRCAVYTSEMLQKIEHAYAVTIHKSQGSEYDAVIIPITGYSRQLLYRNLLYTGVTRAKKILIVIGNRSRIIQMVNNDRKTLRYSCLKQMLEASMGYKDKKDE